MAVEVKQLMDFAEYREDAISRGIVFYCTTSGQVLEGISAAVFEDEEQAEAFLTWLQPTDLRSLSAAQREEEVIKFLANPKHQSWPYSDEEQP